MAPLGGTGQQVIGINGKFPGPIVNLTTNNYLDEDLLITWNGIQHRRNSGEDGVRGTNCPIPLGRNWTYQFQVKDGRNWTYQFQVKDQIGSFFYFPSINFQSVAGGYGGIVVNDKDVLRVPFGSPDGEITILVGDWYKHSHKDLRKTLNDGSNLGMPDGVLINGKGPYQYSTTFVPDGIEHETFNVEPGKTYLIHVHNVETSINLNFRIQSHLMALVETEGTYTMKTNFSNLDIHVGQSYSFLIATDQNATNDYYVVASPRFVNETWTRVVGVAILHYSNSKGKAFGPLPEGPNDVLSYAFSMNQARSIRTNVSVGAT